MPVWNRPVEVRAALAAFVDASPEARLVMVNNGSERETESILDEFAEALDDRALLVAADRNIGSVAALNLGLSKATAPLVLVTSPFTRVADGWLSGVASLLERYPAAGAVSLRSLRGSACSVPVEADHGCFEAMFVRRSLYEAVAGFDESMDGGAWALRDFARRSFTAGFTTFLLPSRQVTFLEQQELGSAVRREERLRHARTAYISRWGEPETFLLSCPESFFGLQLTELEAVLLQAARLGNRVIVTAGSKTAKALLNHGFAAIHENIVLQPLPRLFPGKAFSRIAERTALAEPLTMSVTETGIADSNLKAISFAEFSAQLHRQSERYYQGK